MNDLGGLIGWITVIGIVMFSWWVFGHQTAAAAVVKDPPAPCEAMIRVEATDKPTGKNVTAMFLRFCDDRYGVVCYTDNTGISCVKR